MIIIQRNKKKKKNKKQSKKLKNVKMYGANSITVLSSLLFQ